MGHPIRKLDRKPPETLQEVYERAAADARKVVWQAYPWLWHEQPAGSLLIRPAITIAPDTLYHFERVRLESGHSRAEALKQGISHYVVRQDVILARRRKSKLDAVIAAADHDDIIGEYVQAAVDRLDEMANESSKVTPERLAA